MKQTALNRCCVGWGRFGEPVQHQQPARSTDAQSNLEVFVWLRQPDIPDPEERAGWPISEKGTEAFWRRIEA